MTMITMQDGTQIFYKDWGPKDAQPIVFHHGWPLSSDDWDAQMLFFLSKGYRVVAHDKAHALGAAAQDLRSVDVGFVVVKLVVLAEGSRDTIHN